MSATSRGAPAQSTSADREIVIARVIGAPRELVFEAGEQAWPDADRVALEPVRAEPTQRVTHLTYAVRER